MSSAGGHNQHLIITSDDADDIVPLLDHAHDGSQDRADHNQPFIITADDDDDIIPLLDHAHEELQDRAAQFRIQIPLVRKSYGPFSP